jgi:hypothetical protein
VGTLQEGRKGRRVNCGRGSEAFRRPAANDARDRAYYRWRADGMTKPDTPFPNHWLYYIVLKYVVIAVAVLIALYVASQLL